MIWFGLSDKERKRFFSSIQINWAFFGDHKSTVALNNSRKTCFVINNLTPLFFCLFPTQVCNKLRANIVQKAYSVLIEAITRSRCLEQSPCLWQSLCLSGACSLCWWEYCTGRTGVKVINSSLAEIKPSPELNCFKMRACLLWILQSLHKKSKINKVVYWFSNMSFFFYSHAYLKQ